MMEITFLMTDEIPIVKSIQDLLVMELLPQCVQKYVEMSVSVEKSLTQDKYTEYPEIY